jgi:hypothetical protein
VSGFKAGVSFDTLRDVGTGGFDGLPEAKGVQDVEAVRTYQRAPEGAVHQQGCGSRLR